MSSTSKLDVKEAVEFLDSGERVTNDILPEGSYIYKAIPLNLEPNNIKDDSSIPSSVKINNAKRLDKNLYFRNQLYIVHLNNLVEPFFFTFELVKSDQWKLVK